MLEACEAPTHTNKILKNIRRQILAQLGISQECQMHKKINKVVQINEFQIHLSNLRFPMSP